MKRKRGHKKRKGKGASSAKVAISSSPVVDVETDSGVEELDNDNKNESPMPIDTPSSTGTDQPHSVANVNPEGSVEKEAPKPLGRVTVKLKRAKPMDNQAPSLDVPTQSDTDNSSQQMVVEKTEDSANSLLEAQASAPMDLPKKPGSIKIKSSKVSGLNATNQKEELDTALMVIKKIMKMEAAEPFNVPVNPVALGIPDYFDVIDTPMDFGTICCNLESGTKYANAEDVYKDVQYIWDNCFKYNNKGDYILDLMRRVKKNFSKYWTTAGFYSGQPKGSDESSQEKVAPPGPLKVYVKGGLSKKTSKKGHGRRHKSDCLCAICVLKRRRREREENTRIGLDESGVIDTNHLQELNEEESSPADSGDDSSGMDGSSVDRNADVEKSKESKVEKEGDEDNDLDEENDTEMKDRDNSEATQQIDFEKSTERLHKQSLQESAEKLGDGTQSDTHRGDTEMQHDEGTSVLQHKELQEKRRKVRASEIRVSENPMLLELCGTLFPDNKRKSIWSGPHSLVGRGSGSISRTHSIHSAITMLMKYP